MKIPQEPFPRLVPPMLATLSTLPDDAAAYAFEFKWDGYRAVLYHDGKRTTLKSRNGLDLTPRFPELEALGRALHGPAVLDGEIVAHGPSGAPDFGLLQKRAGQTGKEPVRRLMEEIPVRYMIFDLLHHRGARVRAMPYTERRRRLLDLKLDGPRWSVPPHEVGEGEAMLAVSKKHGFEGVVAKRLDSTYEAGKRSPAWLKVRFLRRQELVIGGYTPGEGALAGSMGSLLLGYHDADGRLRYAGHVGTGFSEKDRLAIKLSLDKARLASSPFADKVDRPRAVFARPKLVAEIKFTEWTAERKLRHPSFVAFRLDKRAREVVWEGVAGAEGRR